MILILFSGISILFIRANILPHYKIKWDILKELYRGLKDNYIVDLDDNTLLNNAINGFLKDLDPYTDFYREEEVTIIDGVINGEYGGIGLSIDRRDGKIVVISPAENSPAYRAGIQPGDYIIKINGQPIKDKSINKVMALVRGKTGKRVTITVQRGENESSRLDFILKTEIIKIKDIPFFSLLDDSIGYIKINHFSRYAPQEVQKILRGFLDTNIGGLIVDLRGNPGGLLSSAVKIADIFLPKGRTIVYTKGRKREYNTTYFSTKTPLYENLPLIILVDQSSASASEIVAGAIQDNDRGIILGKKTFGKGLVQSIFRTNKNTAFKITTSEYFTPSGRSIHNFKNGSEKFERDARIDTFFTYNKRAVIGNGGIIPDIICPEDTLINNIVSLMKRESMFLKFMLNRFPEDRFNVENLSGKDVLLDDFEQFLQKENFIFPFEGLDEIEKLKYLIIDVNYVTLLDSLETHVYLMNKDKKNLIYEHLYRNLKKTIIEARLGEDEVYKYIIYDDPFVINAQNIIKNKSEYYTLITK